MEQTTITLRVSHFIIKKKKNQLDLHTTYRQTRFIIISRRYMS